MLRGVNEPFDGVQSGAGISAHHRGTGVGEEWGVGGGGGVQADGGRPAAGVWGDARASEGSERSQLTFKQGCEDHP